MTSTNNNNNSTNIIDGNDTSLTKVDPIYQKDETLQTAFEKWLFEVELRTQGQFANYWSITNRGQFQVVDENNTPKSEILTLPSPNVNLKHTRSQTVNGCRTARTGGVLYDVTGILIPNTQIILARFPNDKSIETGPRCRWHYNLDPNTEFVGQNKWSPWKWNSFGGYCDTCSRKGKIYVNAGIKNGSTNRIASDIGKYWKLIPIISGFSNNIIEKFMESNLGKPFKYICCTPLGFKAADPLIKDFCNRTSYLSGGQKCDTFMNDYCSKAENEYDISCGCMPNFLINKYSQSTASLTSTQSQQLNTYTKYKDALDLYKKYANTQQEIPRVCIIGTCNTFSAYKFPKDKDVNCPSICNAIVNVNAGRYSAVDMRDIQQTLYCNVAPAPAPPPAKPPQISTNIQIDNIKSSSGIGSGEVIIEGPGEGSNDNVDSDVSGNTTTTETVSGGTSKRTLIIFLSVVGGFVGLLIFIAIMVAIFRSE